MAEIVFSHTGADVRPGIVYAIESRAAGRVYIGSTIRSDRQRWLEHLHYLRKGTHHAQHFQRVFDKYGEGDLSMRIVERVPDGAFVLVREQKHIEANAGRAMNSADVSFSIYAAHEANRGRVMPEEERARRSAAQTGVKRAPWSDERRAAHSIALTGRKMPPVSDERRANLSKASSAYHAKNGTTDGTRRLRTPFSADKLPMCLELRSSGKSFAEIQRMTGIGRKVVAKECRKVGAA